MRELPSPLRSGPQWPAPRLRRRRGRRLPDFVGSATYYTTAKSGPSGTALCRGIKLSGYTRVLEMGWRLEPAPPFGTGSGPVDVRAPVEVFSKDFSAAFNSGLPGACTSHPGGESAYAACRS